MKAKIRVLFLLILTTLAHASSSFEDLEQTIAQMAQNKSGSPLIVAIAGCPGVGKTTIASMLKRELSAQGISTLIISLDNYGLSPEARKQFTSELDPRRIQWNLVHDNLKAILSGELSITKPTINQQTKRMGFETLDLKGIQCIIFEGQYTLSDVPPMNYRPYADLAIFLESSLENIYDWKWEREFKKPNPRSDAEFLHHMRAIIEDFIFHTYPSRKNADYVILFDHLHQFQIFPAQKIKEIPSPNFDPIRKASLKYEAIITPAF